MHDDLNTTNGTDRVDPVPGRERPPVRASGEMTTRRRVLAWLIGASSAAFGVAFALPGLALRTLMAEVKTVDAGDLLVYATGDQSGTAINVESVPPGSALQAFPEGKTEDAQNLIELVRLTEDPSSLVAYSAICTHLGCSVLAELTD